MSQEIELDVSYLKSTLAPIMHLIEDEDINEIKTSPLTTGVGAVWIYSKGAWQSAQNQFGEALTIDNKKINQIIGFAAGMNLKFAHEKKPIVEVALPLLGYRFTGILQPASIGCSKFNIRKFTTSLFTFEDYAKQGVIDEEDIAVLRGWLLKDNFSVAIAGDTNSGKTTFVSSVINEKRTMKPNENWVVIEDTKELNIPAGNVDRLITTNQVDMDMHLQTTLRLTPDNCVIGEVRGKEASTALELAKVKNVLFTMHAGTFNKAMSRFERMILKHPEVDKIDRQDIGDYINGVIVLRNIKRKTTDKHGNDLIVYERKVTEIVQLDGYDTEDNIYQKTTLK